MELVGACVKQPNLALVQPLMLRGSLYDALHGAKKLDPTKYTWKLYLKIANDIASGKSNASLWRLFNKLTRRCSNELPAQLHVEQRQTADHSS